MPDHTNKPTEPAIETKLEAARDRTDGEAAAQVTMLEGAIKNNPDMDPDVKARFMVDLLSARGQLQSAEERAKAEKRMGGDKTPPR